MPRVISCWDEVSIPHPVPKLPLPFPGSDNFSWLNYSCPPLFHTGAWSTGFQGLSVEMHAVSERNTALPWLFWRLSPFMRETWLHPHPMAMVLSQCLVCEWGLCPDPKTWTWRWAWPEPQQAMLAGGPPGREQSCRDMNPADTEMLFEGVVLLPWKKYISYKGEHLCPMGPYTRTWVTF